MSRMRAAPRTGVVENGPILAAVPGFDQGLFLMHLNRARKLIGSSRLNEARDKLEEALKLRPQDEITLDLLGMAYSRLDMRPQAAAIYRRLLQDHPEADVLHANLGILEFKDGRYDDARRRLETALLLNPKNPRPHLYLGLIEHVLGDLDSCVEHLKLAGAEDLAARVLSRGLLTQGSPALLSQATGQNLPPDSGDTGPMRKISANQVGSGTPLSLGEVVAERSAWSHLSGESAFTVMVAGSPGAACEILQIEFPEEIRVRAGSAMTILSGDGALHSGSPDTEGLVALRGRGRVELIPEALMGKGVLLMRLRSGQCLNVGPSRLLAHETGLAAIQTSGLADGAIPGLPGPARPGPLRVTGDGILALTAGRWTHALQVLPGDNLWVSPRNLVCWTEGLGAVSDGSGRYDSVLQPGPIGAAAICLEGAGEALIDLPA